MPTFLTVKEAATQTGRSSSSIRRIIYPIIKKDKHPDRSHVEPTVKFYLELEAKKVPAEMHIYTYGGHGFGLRPAQKAAPVSRWPDRLKEWLAEREISKR